MIKKTSLFMVIMVVCANSLFAQHTITIEGKIRFPAPQGDMMVVQSQGFDRVTLASSTPSPDGTYRLEMRVNEPGAYTLMCQGHERVLFWAEDENLEIDFRGMDTARVRYIGPTYVHIKGGVNNDLMNMINWQDFRSYWTNVDIYNAPRKTEGLTEEQQAALSALLNPTMSKDNSERIRHIARHYGHCNSAITLLPRLRDDQELYDEVLARLEARDPNYAPLVAYKTRLAEDAAQRARLAAGNQAPAFSYPTADGDKSLGPADFKGKILVIDFWASWCGPCRAEIPHLKEAYEKYSGKEVEFLNVSIDRDQAAWRRAMAEENMPWSQVLAPEAGREVMTLYQFSGIPHIVVIDQEGNIVGRNYRGKALMDKLEELTSGAAARPRSIPMGRF